jgi:uncharacterized damage-inducible protein DinB
MSERAAVEALLDEHQRAMAHLLAFIQPWDEETLDRTVLGDATRTYRQVLQHVATAAYFGYFVWTQRMLEWDVLPPPVPARERITDFHRLSALREILAQTTPYGRQALARLTDEQLDKPQFMSNWNEPYTIDQMLEHAVVHVWRHLRQLERAEKARPGRA